MSKNVDFSQRILFSKPPPKVIQLNLAIY
ncbi:MAG: hypothetical protein AAF694_03970 [Bacteroidota bacterium]